MFGFLIIFTSFLLLMPSPLVEEREKIKVGIDNYVLEMIDEIEKDGYITQKTEFEASKKLTELGVEDFEITGTYNKVEKGEDVFLNIKAITEVPSFFTTTKDIDRYYQSGIAK